MSLAEHVHIARRFQRAVRIDVDFASAEAIDGFICPRSSTEVLLSMAKHLEETGHGAFTWTGPYGSGKSSLVVALHALLCGKKSLQNKATKSIGKDAAKLIRKGFGFNKVGWKILPVIGRREDPVRVIGQAIETTFPGDTPKNEIWSENRLLDGLMNIATHEESGHKGLIVFIDEMGKFLEGAVQDGSDVYIFQQIAELASRSNKRLVIIGILHQAFEEYAHRLSRDMRDEWSKIQGRYIDLALNTAGEEQIDLVSRAIISDHPPTAPGDIAQKVSKFINDRKPSTSKHLPQILEECWPLHPVAACLLGPISRRRFGQNQRSLFGFLNSVEPFGFHDYLRNNSNAFYTPDQLWDYLKVNLESSILASPDGHRWSTAVDAIERCESLGNGPLDLSVLKTIAIVDLFKERSGLSAEIELLATCFPEQSEDEINSILKGLKKDSLIVYRKFASSFSIYAGSDFDIDIAIESARSMAREIDFVSLQKASKLQPILAKRFYHETGALWWFDVEIVALSDLEKVASDFRPNKGIIGKFLLAIPENGQTEEDAEKICRIAARKSKDWDIVVGLSQRSWVIMDLSRELLALDKVRNESSELSGDSVARREVMARISTTQSQLESELNNALNNTTWYRKNAWKKSAKPLCYPELNALTSNLVRDRFKSTPIIKNELLNRIKPSSNAVAAQNNLLRRMVLNEGEYKLGIEGMPAEGGLFLSLLGSTGLYKEINGTWGFAAPHSISTEKHNLIPVWHAAEGLLKENEHRTVSVSEIYEVWRQPPYGIKDGLMPVLVVAFILSHRENLSFYREGVFQPKFKDIDVDYLVKDANDIQLRWMNLSNISKELLSKLTDVVQELGDNVNTQYTEPIDIARGLIAIYDALQPWTKRTVRLSKNAIQIRSLFKQAKDPNKFLFEDIPRVIGKKAPIVKEDDLLPIIANIKQGLEELVNAYPSMLNRLRDTMLMELHVPNASPQALLDLRSRAENISQLSGDFRLNAFIGRMSHYTGELENIEGIASLAANKPPKNWVDTDLDRAAIEIADFSQKFLRIETYARVKGRATKRQALAVIVGVDDYPKPFHIEFEVKDSELAKIKELTSELKAVIEKSANKDQKNLILAALATLSAQHIQAEQKVATKNSELWENGEVY